MINGAHVIVYSEKPEEDSKFFKDVLRFPHVDVGSGFRADVANDCIQKNAVFGLLPIASSVKNRPPRND